MMRTQNLFEFEYRFEININLNLNAIRINNSRIPIIHFNLKYNLLKAKSFLLDLLEFFFCY